MAILLVIGLCIWGGYSKGLFMSIAGIVVLVASLIIGGIFASAFAPVVADQIEPYIGWLSDDAAEKAVLENYENGVPKSADSQENAVSQAFSQLGIAPSATDRLTQMVVKLVNDVNMTMNQAISSVFTRTLTYVLIFVVVFALCAMILSIIANIINSALRFPVLNFMNKTGGIIVGAIYGLFLVFVAAWIIRFLGVVIPQDVLDSTLLTKFFMSFNPVSLMLGI